jgi:hypothetical protein
VGEHGMRIQVKWESGSLRKKGVPEDFRWMVGGFTKVTSPKRE